MAKISMKIAGFIVLSVFLMEIMSATVFLAGIITDSTTHSGIGGAVITATCTRGAAFYSKDVTSYADGVYVASFDTDACDSKTVASTTSGDISLVEYDIPAGGGTTWTGGVGGGGGGAPLPIPTTYQNLSSNNQAINTSTENKETTTATPESSSKITGGFIGVLGDFAKSPVGTVAIIFVVLVVLSIIGILTQKRFKKLNASKK
jgi:hypothetical protein